MSGKFQMHNDDGVNWDEKVDSFEDCEGQDCIRKSMVYWDDTLKHIANFLELNLPEKY